MEQYLEGRPLASNLSRMRSRVSLVCRHVLVSRTRRDTRVRAFPTLSLRAHHKDEVRWGHNERTAICKPELAPESSHVGTLILDFQPQSCERIHFYCLSHPTYSILLWQLEQTKIIHLGLSLICTVAHTCRQALFPVFVLKGWFFGFQMVSFCLNSLNQ